ncbi:hypothetical protein [Streptoalloteichus hindustanus]|uniref:hypothetical protein n=1 Tax=Streptoalloteichus hindustanus TaxID=2017 RepID=UPI00116131C2|nr:hypothetical protein [Streptoalloteichus hindustanus]
MSTRLPFRGWVYRAALTMLVLTGAFVVATFSSSQSSAEPEDRTPRAPLAPVVDRPVESPTPLPNAVAAQVHSAPAGRTIAHGPNMTVDEFTLNEPATLKGGNAPVRAVARLTITGDFPTRSLDPTVLVDDKPVGRGIAAVDERSISVALTDFPSVRSGSVVKYRYGSGPATTVGQLTLGGK